MNSSVFQELASSRRGKGPSVRLLEHQENYIVISYTCPTIVLLPNFVGDQVILRPAQTTRPMTETIAGSQSVQSG